MEFLERIRVNFTIRNPFLIHVYNTGRDLFSSEISSLPYDGFDNPTHHHCRTYSRFKTENLIQNSGPIKDRKDISLDPQPKTFFEPIVVSGYNHSDSRKKFNDTRKENIIKYNVKLKEVREDSKNSKSSNKNYYICSNYPSLKKIKIKPSCHEMLNNNYNGFHSNDTTQNKYDQAVNNIRNDDMSPDKIFSNTAFPSFFKDHSKSRLSSPKSILKNDTKGSHDLPVINVIGASEDEKAYNLGNEEIESPSTKMNALPFITASLERKYSNKDLLSPAKEQALKLLELFSSDSLSQVHLSQINIQNNDTKDFDLIKPVYRKFIKRTFAKENQERLRTFGKFAFSTVEKDDHKDIVPFLNDLRSPTEPRGSMNIVDLWPSELQRTILKQTSLQNEKRMVEKFSFYFSKFRKNSCKEQKPVIFSKKEENLYKNLIQMKNSKVEFAKKQANRVCNLKFLTADPILKTSNRRLKR